MAVKIQPRIRAGLLVGLQPAVEGLGGDIKQVMELAQVSKDVLVNPEHYIPYRSYLRVLAAAAQCTNSPDFGLHMSRTLGAGNMGVTGFVMTQAVSVGSAWASLQRFYHVHDTYGAVTLTESEGLACVRYEIPLAGLPGEQQSLDVAAGVATNIHRMLCGHDARLVSICFPYSRPLDLNPYEPLSSDQFLFEQAGFAMFFPAHLLRRPVASANPEMKEFLETYLESLELAGQHAASLQVEKLIRDFLSTGDCTLSHVANFLSTSVRALQNRLSDEQTSYQMLLDKIRRELAVKHLIQGDMQLTQLAYLLGYSELSAFSRSFKKWYGMSPRNWQRSQLVISR
ncbi:MAG: AraC family transcriptional regulator [Halioglobus sp.]